MGIFAHNTFFTNMRTQNTEFHHFDHTNIPNEQTTPKTTINNFCNFLTETHPPSPTSPTYKSTTFTHQTEPFNHPSQLIGRFSSSSSLSSLFPPASSPTLSHSPSPSLSFPFFTPPSSPPPTPPPPTSPSPLLSP